MIKKVYVRAERFHLFYTFKVNMEKLENFKRMKRRCKTFTPRRMVQIHRVPCLPTGRHTILYK